MQWLDQMVDKWHAYQDAPRPRLEKTGKNLRKTGNFLVRLWHYLYMLRGIILSLPVATVAIILAAKCNTDLPEVLEVTLPGIDTRSAEALFGFLVYHTELVARSTAVMATMVLTLGCLLLTICSKRILYPWLISIFTLSVPVFLLLTNGYL